MRRLMVRRKSTFALVGVVLIGVGIWLVVANILRCLSEPDMLLSGGQCPPAYIGLSVAVLFTVGLTSLAIRFS